MSRLLLHLHSYLTLSLVIGMIAVASADIAPTLNYQGRLTDTSGDPVADGSYDLTFRIYNDPVGGTQLWTSGASPIPVTVANGLFSVILGDAGMEPLPENIFSGQMLHLGIQLDGEPEFSPRQPIVATPYSLRANYAEEAQNAQFLGGLGKDGFMPITGGTMIGQMTINILGGGEEFLFTRGQTLGNSAMVMYYEGDPRIALYGLDQGSQLVIGNQSGQTLVSLQAEPSVGGTLGLRNVNGQYGINMYGGGDPAATQFDLSANGIATLRVTASVSQPVPKMVFIGNSGIPEIEFDPGAVSPGSRVYLPAQSIDGYEIADNAINGDKIQTNSVSVDVLSDDARGAQNTSSSTTSYFLVGSGQQTIMNAVIDAPAAGYVLAIASFNLKVYHVSATRSEAIFGLTDDPPNLPEDQSRVYIIWPSITSGTFGELISLQRIFPVEEGITTIALTGEKTSGVNSHELTGATISLLYFRTAYGTIE